VRLRPRQPPDLRTIAVGALAEVALVLQEHMAPHLGQLLPPLLREMRSDDPVCRQNAAFAIGVLCEGCGQSSAQYHSQMLQSLYPLFGKDEVGEVRDNAAGAVGRLLLAAGPAAPIEQVLPTFLAALPPRDDPGEATPAYSALARLVTSGETAARVMPMAAGMLHAFGAAAVQPGIPQDALRSIGGALAAMQAQYAEQLTAMVHALPEEQQQGLARLMAAAQQQ